MEGILRHILSSDVKQLPIGTLKVKHFISSSFFILFSGDVVYDVAVHMMLHRDVAIRNAVNSVLHRLFHSVKISQRDRKAFLASRPQTKPQSSSLSEFSRGLIISLWQTVMRIDCTSKIPEDWYGEAPTMGPTTDITRLAVETANMRGMSEFSVRLLAESNFSTSFPLPTENKSTSFPFLQSFQFSRTPFDSLHLYSSACLLGALSTCVMHASSYLPQDLSAVLALVFVYSHHPAVLSFRTGKGKKSKSLNQKYIHPWLKLLSRFGLQVCLFFFFF
jgi:hypothetical protein